MAAITIPDDFINYLMQGAINLANGGHTFKVVIHTDALVEATDNDITDLTQITGAGGYAAATLSGQAISEPSTGTFMWDATDPTFTASGANFDAGRYLAIYDDTTASPVADPLVCGWDYGANFTLTDGNTLTLVLNANGILRIS